MSEFNPVSTLSELDLLDQDEIVSGYRSGLDGEGEPGSNKIRGFWHGWRNGRVDRGLARIDEHQTRLAREFVNKYPGH